jgi:hypothetical protein
MTARDVERLIDPADSDNAAPGSVAVLPYLDSEMCERQGERIDCKLGLGYAFFDFFAAAPGALPAGASFFGTAAS